MHLHNIYLCHRLKFPVRAQTFENQNAVLRIVPPKSIAGRALFGVMPISAPKARGCKSRLCPVPTCRLLKL